MDDINSHIKKIEFIFEDYEERCKKLKNICKELRDKNQESAYIFGLDTFFFQITLFNIDYQHFRKLHAINLNRFYCNYKHLSKIIINFIENYITNKKIFKIIDFFKPFKNYNSLDIYSEYDFIITKKLYLEIDKSIDLLQEHLEDKQKQLDKYKSFNDNGLNLHDFINQYQKTVDTIDYYLNIIRKHRDDINNKHIFYLNHTMKKINITYLNLKSIKINDILSKNIKCQDKIIHEKNLSKVHDELNKS